MTNEDQVALRIGRRVKHLRVQAGMRYQWQLAAKLHLKQQTISEIERGIREIKPSELGRFARALGVTPDQITGEPGYTGFPISLTGTGKVNSPKPD